MRCFIASLAVLPLALGTPSAMAQMSADQIIKSLTPTGDVSKSQTRGIRMSPGTSESAPALPAAAGNTAPKAPAARPGLPASQMVASSAAAQPAGPSVNLTVNFPSGSADLTPEAMASLDQLGKALSSDALANYRFRVEGHTDTVGSRTANRTLSERRAEAVVAYMVSKYGVAGNRLQAVGMGSDRPVVMTQDQVAEPRNRRVQVINLGS